MVKTGEGLFLDRIVPGLVPERTIRLTPAGTTEHLANLRGRHLSLFSFQIRPAEPQQRNAVHVAMSESRYKPSNDWPTCIPPPRECAVSSSGYSVSLFSPKKKTLPMNN